MRMQNTTKLKYKGKTPIHIGGGLKIVVLNKGDIYECTETQAQHFIEHSPDKWERVGKEKSVDEQQQKPKSKKSKGGKQ